MKPKTEPYTITNGSISQQHSNNTPPASMPSGNVITTSNAIKRLGKLIKSTFRSLFSLCVWFFSFVFPSDERKLCVLLIITWSFLSFSFIYRNVRDQRRARNITFLDFLCVFFLLFRLFSVLNEIFVNETLAMLFIAYRFEWHLMNIVSRRILWIAFDERRAIFNTTCKCFRTQKYSQFDYYWENYVL